MEVSDFEEGRLEDALTHGPGLCPRCHEHAAGFDYLQGLSVCEACGHVLQDEELVSQVLFVGKEDQKPAGVIVGSKDSGLEASLRMLRGTRVGTAVHRTRPKNSAIHVAKTVKEISNKMHLSSSVASEAELYMEKVLKAAHGSWRLELVAASAVYMAIRQNNVPLTLLDLADATHQNLYALGRYYRLAIRMLDIHPPPIRVADHLHRALARYYASTSVQKGVENDATEVLHWMEEQFIEGSRHPLVMLGVAILVSLEMNNVSCNNTPSCEQQQPAHILLADDFFSIFDALECH
jgi:transcription initiation factor TFIIIB Brf1 subunit/transcription initiation factor TFIIB